MAINDGSDDSRRKLTLLTNGFRITGHGTLMPGSRVTDFLNDSAPFIALTDAEVWQIEESRKLMSAPFLNVNRNCVEVVIPADPVESLPKQR